jgi:hypothetical protein
MRNITLFNTSNATAQCVDFDTRPVLRLRTFLHCWVCFSEFQQSRMPEGRQAPYTPDINKPILRMSILLRNLNILTTCNIQSGIVKLTSQFHPKPLRHSIYASMGVSHSVYASTGAPHSVDASMGVSHSIYASMGVPHPFYPCKHGGSPFITCII